MPWCHGTMLPGALPAFQRSHWWRPGIWSICCTQSSLWLSRGNLAASLPLDSSFGTYGTVLRQKSEKLWKNTKHHWNIYATNNLIAERADRTCTYWGTHTCQLQNSLTLHLDITRPLLAGRYTIRLGKHVLQWSMWRKPCNSPLSKLHHSLRPLLSA